MSENDPFLNELHDLHAPLDVPLVVSITDARGVITHVNDRFCELSGYRRDELVGKTHATINSGFHSKTFFRDLWRSIRRGHTWRGEVRNRAKNGEFFWLDTTIIPFLDEDGEAVKFLSVRSDITARKSGEQASSQELIRRLAREEKQKTGILESLSEAFISLDRDFRCIYINPAAERYLGSTIEQLRGRDMWEVFPDAVGTRFEREFRKAMAKREEIVFEEFYKPNGSWLELRAFPWEDGLAIFYRDVTGRKRAEELIREKNQLLEQTYDAIFIWNPDEGIVSWNANAEKLYGYTAAEAIGREVRELLKTEYPTSFRQFVADLGRNGFWEGELIQTTRTGENVIVESRQHVMRHDESRLTVIETSRDVTDRRRLESKLSRSAKLALVGELAAGLAHEIKNPLAGIKGVVDILLERRRAVKSDESEILESVRSEIDRIDRTVRMLLRNSRPKPVEIRRAALDDTIRRAVKLASYQFHQQRSGAEPIRLVLPENHLLVPHDESSIEDAVLNLILNAGDAIGDRPNGLMTVALESDGKAALISVSDNGCGIETAKHDEIFLPFKTSKNDGTGLGLTAVKRIARAHGGDCAVESVPGKGSTFTIILPLGENTPRVR
ncbi:MAG: PAS domain S-box protein [Acidobacteria bacterium]|nr:PAS domain S-box protein [Acidobacteriota bacterium]